MYIHIKALIHTHTRAHTLPTNLKLHAHSHTHTQARQTQAFAHLLKVVQCTQIRLEGIQRRKRSLEQTTYIICGKTLLNGIMKGQSTFIIFRFVFYIFFAVQTVTPFRLFCSVVIRFNSIR